MNGHTKNSKRKATSTLLAMSLGLMGMVAFVPGAAAHYCQAEEGNPGEESCQAECTTGEYHDHKITHHHENGIYKDENHTHYSCKSSYKAPDKECDGPAVLESCVYEIFDPRAFGFDPENTDPENPPEPRPQDVWDLCHWIYLGIPAVSNPCPN